MCETIETSKVITRQHNGRSVEVSNPNYREVGVIQVDGCLINDASRRIDWMIRLPEKKKMKDGTACLKLVELKGSDVLYACTQMRATMKHAAVASEVSLINEAYIVSQQRPSMASVFQIEIIKFRTEFEIPLRVVSPCARIDASY